MERRIKVLILDDEINPVGQLTSSILELMPETLLKEAKEDLAPMVNEWNDNRRKDSETTFWTIDSVLEGLVSCSLAHPLSFNSSFKASDFPETHSAIRNFLEKLPLEIRVFKDDCNVLKCQKQSLSGALVDDPNPYDIVIADWKLKGYDLSSYPGLMGNRILLYAHHRKALVGFYSAYKEDMLDDPDNRVAFEILKPNLVEIVKNRLSEGVYELYLKFIEQKIKDLPYEDLLEIENAINIILGLGNKENKINWANRKNIPIRDENFTFYHLFPFLTWATEANSGRVAVCKRDLSMILEDAKLKTATGMIRMLYDNPKIKRFLHDPSQTEAKDITDLVKEKLGLEPARCNNSEDQGLNEKHKVYLDLKCDIHKVFRKQSKTFDCSKVRGIRKFFRIRWDDIRSTKDNGYSCIDEIIKTITGIDIQRVNEMGTPPFLSYFFSDAFLDGMRGLIGEIKNHGGGLKSTALEFINEKSVVVKIEQEKHNFSGIKDAQSNLKLSIERLKLFCSVKASGKFGSSQKIWNCGGYFEEGKDSPGLWILTFRAFRAEEE